MTVPKKLKGFTLAEIIIVVFIIALIATVILLRFRTPTFDTTPQAQANQILRFMEIVQEQAILQPAVLGIKFSDHEYQVFQLHHENNQDEWISLVDKNAFWKAKKIPNHIVVHLQTNQEGDNFSPNLIFLPSGEVTPFILEIKEKDDERAYVIRGDDAGNLILGVS